MDIAEGTFIARMPHWLRWSIFLPAAIIFPLTLLFIQRITMIVILGLDSHAIFVDAIGDFIIGAGFVGTGAMIVPKGQFLCAIILLVLLTFFSVFILLSALSHPDADVLLQLFTHGVVIGSGVYVVYQLHEQQEFKSLN